MRWNPTTGSGCLDKDSIAEPVDGPDEHMLCRTDRHQQVAISLETQQ